MNPIQVAFAFDQESGNYKLAYAGPSYDEARTSLAAAITSKAEIGWIMRNVEPSETMRAIDITEEPPPEEYMQPPIYDLESAIGLAKLPDGRTVVAGDEKRSQEMAPNFEKDISGQELDAATYHLRAEHEQKAHAFSREGLEERAKMTLEMQQGIEDEYAKNAGLVPRNVDSDYSEAEHVAKQRADEASRADDALRASEAEISAAEARRREREQQQQPR